MSSQNSDHELDPLEGLTPDERAAAAALAELGLDPAHLEAAQAELEREAELDRELAQEYSSGTAAEKVARTLRELANPREGAAELELTLATVCMALERTVGRELEGPQESGELDRFMLRLVRFLALHRSDTAQRLVVVELPRRRELPAGTRLHALDLAERAAAEDPDNPLL